MAWLPEIPAQKFSILSGSREEEIAIRVKAKVGDTPLVASQQGKRRTIIPGIQAYGAAVGATGIEGLGWTEGYTGDDTALALLFGSQSLPGLDVEKTRTVRLKPQKSWEPSGEKQSEWAAVNSSRWL